METSEMFDLAAVDLFYLMNLHTEVMCRYMKTQDLFTPATYGHMDFTARYMCYVQNQRMPLNILFHTTCFRAERMGSQPESDGQHLADICLHCQQGRQRSQTQK